MSAFFWERWNLADETPALPGSSQKNIGIISSVRNLKPVKSVVRR
jgi:hypothetical protein